MRKYLVAAVAATAAIGVGTAAAQDSGSASLKATLKPAKAGTKKKPQNVSLHTDISTTVTDHSVGKIQIQMPKTFKVSGKGFPKCSAATVEATAGKGCPKGSKIGGGTANAVAGIGQSNQVNVDFKVTGFVAANNKLAFLLQAQGLSNVYTSPAKVVNTKKGPKLNVTVPAEAQQPVPGLYASLKRLNTTLGAKRGKHKLIATTGCKHHKAPISAKLIYAVNPVSSAGSITAKGSARCK